MKGTKSSQLTGSLFSILLISLAIVQLSMADAIDEFNSPTLNPDLWDMKIEGNASYEIDDGILTMESPDIDSGIILYYPQNLAGIDITIEIKLDLSVAIGDNVVMGFLGGLMEPQINTDINDNWQANFFFVPANWYIKQDPIVIGEKPPNPADLQGPYDNDWNVVRIESSATKGTIAFFLNGDEAGEVDMNMDVTDRYFYISPDTYTSHFTGQVAIDYIRFSGPGAPVLAVEPMDKLSTTWGDLKK